MVHMKPLCAPEQHGAVTCSLLTREPRGPPKVGQLDSGDLAPSLCPPEVRDLRLCTGENPLKPGAAHFFIKVQKVFPASRATLYIVFVFTIF